MFLPTCEISDHKRVLLSAMPNLRIYIWAIPRNCNQLSKFEDGIHDFSWD